LAVAYDGTDFSGWAVQPQRRTVAGVLTEALERVLGPVTGLTVAGRTDAGVHATGQVCHVDVASFDATLVRRLAGLLPGDVRVLSAAEAPVSFDARFSALWRRYEYRVSDAPYGPLPLRRHDTLFHPRPLDLTALTAASAGLTGEHDFAAYCKRKEHATTVRTIQRLDWRRDPADGVVAATVQADAFCQAMVRSLVGALLPVGDGRRAVDVPVALLGRTERASEITVAPPHGLTLVEVGYPADPDGYAARTELTRGRRTPHTP
jgi:tRNA pseudouridine38-40 synthase